MGTSSLRGTYAHRMQKEYRAGAAKYRSNFIRRPRNGNKLARSDCDKFSDPSADSFTSALTKKGEWAAQFVNSLGTYRRAALTLYTDQREVFEGYGAEIDQLDPSMQINGRYLFDGKEYAVVGGAGAKIVSVTESGNTLTLTDEYGGAYPHQRNHNKGHLQRRLLFHGYHGYDIHVQCRLKIAVFKEIIFIVYYSRRQIVSGSVFLLKIRQTYVTII